jgi:hypothetical protein
MKIELEMTDEQFADMQMDFADIVWSLGADPELQRRAIRLFNLLDMEVPHERLR